MQVIDEAEIRAAIKEPEALASAEKAFRAMAEGGVELPPPMGLEVQAGSESELSLGNRSRLPVVSGVPRANAPGARRSHPAAMTVPGTCTKAHIGGPSAFLLPYRR